jgi:hypothetical protein
VKASRTIYASQSRTATDPAPVDQSDDQAIGVRVVLDVTVIATAPALTVNIEGLDKTSGKYYLLLASTAVATVSTTVLTVFPGAAVAANVSANNYLPDTWRVRVVHGNANAVTYSVGVEVFSEVV